MHMQAGKTAKSPGGTFEVAVLIGGRPQDLYRRHDGQLFVAGAAGESFTLQVRNLAHGRAEFLTSLDGRNTLKDETADKYANTGLVLPGLTTTQFRGWRVTDYVVREFVFTFPEKSVAAVATGSTANTGVIGFAVYQEKRRERPAYEVYAVASAGPPVSYGGVATRGMSLDSSNAGGGSQASLGTGIGDRVQDHVGRTEFTRAPGEPDVLVIRYDTREALEAAGVIQVDEPSAFPGAETGYAQYETTR
jgi:hypothetical protein